MLKMIFGLTKKFQILIYNTIMQQYPIKAIIYSLSKVEKGYELQSMLLLSYKTTKNNICLTKEM
jgi:hypothetical protein